MRRTTGCAVALLLACAAPLAAQTLAPIPLGASSKLTVSVEERARWEYRENADFREAKDDTNSFVGNRLRLGLRFDVTERFTAFFQGQDSRQWGSDLKFTDLSAHYDDLRQAYLELRAAKGALKGFSLRVGRQEILLGEERLVGAFGWSNVGRSFDAAKLRYGAKGFFVEGFYADARTRPLVPDKSTQSLWGADAGLFQGRPASLELYALVKEDRARVQGETAAPARNTEISTWGGRLLWKPAKGLAFMAEAAWQTGHRGPDAHRADAQALRVDYVFPGEWKPAAGVEYDRASGDSDPADGRSGSFDNLFPTNHNKYGLMDCHNWSNLGDLRFFGSAKPRPWLTLALEAHDFRLDSARAPWTSAGGAVLGWDKTGRSGTRVGREVDFTAGGTFRKAYSWLAGCSAYWPGNFARATRGGDASRFVYVQFGLSF